MRGCIFRGAAEKFGQVAWRNCDEPKGGSGHAETNGRDVQEAKVMQLAVGVRELAYRTDGTPVAIHHRKRSGLDVRPTRTSTVREDAP